ncbi:MAG TPA: 2-dehydro-3-deoxyphosphogluconate aldolase, partial [Planctomycetaceae bacterium]|nr:2-dehydro-3-deoxyphosphogluconate aldolase [Planctomycetaceae bacterium]
PGFNPKVVRHCLDKELPIFPGVSSPTEIEMALDHGLQTVKFFPAEALGGLKTLKAIAAPYQMIRFIPTGGIGADNLAEYLAFAPVLACGGSWMVKPALYADGNFKPVESAVRKATTIVT